MSSLNYNGGVVEGVVSELNGIINEFSSLSNSMKSATNKIVSARGFNEYVGGISSDSFSNAVINCEEIVSDYVKTIRNKQISILSFSNDEEEIKTFLNGLSRQEFDSLDLSSLDDYVSVGMKAENVFKGLGASVLTFGLGLIEGVADFAETGADLITLGGSLFKSVFTLGYDLLTGEDTTKKMWEETKAKVSEKKVESIFNSFYDNNPIGKSLKENAYLFEGVRGVGKGLGYSAGIIGTSMITGGLTSGLGIGAPGSIGIKTLATTAGVMGFSNGTEEAWADGASIEKGLLYGAATGAWEGTQWAIGAKINQYGGIGDRVASGIFKGAEAGVGTRIFMDTIDSAAEGFVQPALSMIYKDYGADNIFDNYANAFESAGGWSNVIMQGAIGGLGSAFSEVVGARKLLKSAKDADGDVDARRIFEGMDDDFDTRRMLGDLDEDDIVRAGSGNRTIDGKPIASNSDNPFRTSDMKTAKVDGITVKGDGSFLSLDGSDITRFDRLISLDEADRIIEANRDYLNAETYKRLKRANDIFRSSGVSTTSINELKLISVQSNGNMGRISSALSMYGIDGDQNKALASQLASQVFIGGDDATSFRRKLINEMIDDYRSKTGDSNWSGAGKILMSMDTDARISMAGNLDLKRQAIDSYFGKGYIADSTVDKLLKSDGLPSSIRKILIQDGNIPESMIDTLADGAAVKIFASDNYLNLRALAEFKKGNFTSATKCIRTIDTIDGYGRLFKVANEIDNNASNRLLYSFYDTLVNEYSLGTDEAFDYASKLFNSSLYESGLHDGYITRSGTVTSRSILRDFDEAIFAGIDDTRSPIYGNSYMNRYKTGNGYDIDRLVRDFQSYADDSIKNFRNRVPAGVTIDPIGTEKANRVFFQSYIDAATDTNNPNRGEALRAMAKLLELNENGRGIFVGCDAYDSSFCNASKNRINLGVQTVNNAERGGYGVIYHETGHYIFSIAEGSTPPTNITTLLDDVTRNLDRSGKNNVRVISDNIRSIQTFIDAATDNSLDRTARAKGFDGLEGYRQHLIDQFSNMSVAEREAAITKVVKYQSSSPLRDFDVSKVDLSTPQKTADYNINLLRSKVSDRIWVTQFGDYANMSSMIDSATLGKTRITYGHGANYFNSSPFPYKLAFDELVADYSSLKLAGDNLTINRMRSILGDELMDQIDKTYQSMLK